MSASYFVFHGYAYTDFLEYPLLITQQLILVSMHLKFNRIIVSPIAILAMILAYFMKFTKLAGEIWLANYHF